MLLLVPFFHVVFLQNLESQDFLRVFLSYKEHFCIRPLSNDAKKEKALNADSFFGGLASEEIFFFHVLR